MACNICETNFQGYQAVVASIQQSGSSALLYVQNQGRNIVMIRRILLCYDSPDGTGILYLRPPPDPISWLCPTAFLENGTLALYYELSVPNLKLVQAQAEYIEIEGHSLSCAATS